MPRVLADRACGVRTRDRGGRPAPGGGIALDNPFNGRDGIAGQINLDAELGQHGGGDPHGDGDQELGDNLQRVLPPK